MSTNYNRIAGQSLERLAALSDGIFAVAMTLLVLNLSIPASKVTQVHTELDLWNALVGIAPSLLTYLMSFLTLGIFWVGQQTQLNHFARSNRDLAWLHLGFLLAVTLMPFSTSLLAAFFTFRIALVTYWLNIFLLGAMLFASWRYAQHAGLLKDEVTAELCSATERRIVIAQGYDPYSEREKGLVSFLWSYEQTDDAGKKSMLYHVLKSHALKADDDFIKHETGLDKIDPPLIQVMLMNDVLRWSRGLDQLTKELADLLGIREKLEDQSQPHAKE